MDVINLQSIVTTIVTTVILSLAGYIFHQLKSIIKELEHIEPMSKNVIALNEKVDNIQADLCVEQECSLSMLRDRIRQKCKHQIELGCMCMEDREVLQKMYDMYKRKGGNGSIDRIVKDAFSLPYE